LTQTPTPEPSTAVPTVTPNQAGAPSDATAASDHATSQPTATAARIALATTVSATAGGRPKPSASPKSPGTLPPRSQVKDQAAQFPWVLILGLIGAAGGLILLGGVGLWWMRKKK
jgi:hypothetical protein